MKPALTINKTMTPLEWGMLISLSLLWGGSFFFGGVAVKELPTLSIVVSRVGIAALILLLIMKITGDRLPRSREVWFALFGMGFLNNVIPFSLIIWGQSHIASGLASILNATTPLFTVLVAHFLTQDEKLTPARLLGVVIGFLGVGFMIGGEFFQSPGNNIFGQIAILGAAISYSFAVVYGRRFKDMGLSSMATATGQVTASSIMLIPIMLIVDQPWNLTMPGMSVIGALIGLAALSTSLAYVLYFRILATAGPTNLSIVTFLIPVSAILLGAVFLGEVLQTKHFIGMTMIGLGLAVLDGRLWKYIRKP